MRRRKFSSRLILFRRADHTERVTTLDERTGAFLEHLSRLCGGGYHLFEEDELKEFLPEGTLGETLFYLADCRCIDMRYAEDGAYCLRILPAGRVQAAFARERARERASAERRTALAAFLGALTGTLLFLAPLFVLLARR